MENRNYIIDRLTSKRTSIEEFEYDRLTAPPLSSMLSPYDIAELNRVAKSIKLSSKPKEKLYIIDQIMRRRGFEKFIGGTNRISYRPVEDNRFLVKIAIDAVGLNDNPAEFRNQYIFKPFVTKVFEISPCGTVGVFERVNPITSREEFLSVAKDIFEVINTWFVGEYVLADIGTKFFMNWGIRKNFGPVLLDFPYVYKLDGNKLFCAAPDPSSPTGRCEGVIDYDNGFNFLYCTKCGARYKAKELAEKITNKALIMREKGDTNMKIKVTGGRRNISETITVGENGNIVKSTPVRPKPTKKPYEKPEVKVEATEEPKKKPVAAAYEMPKKEEPKKEVQSPIEFDESLKKENRMRVLAEALSDIIVILNDDTTKSTRAEYISMISQSLARADISVTDTKDEENKTEEVADMNSTDVFYDSLEKASKRFHKVVGTDYEETKNDTSGLVYGSALNMFGKDKEKIAKNADLLGSAFIEFIMYIGFRTNFKIFVTMDMDNEAALTLNYDEENKPTDLETALNVYVSRVNDGNVAHNVFTCTRFVKHKGEKLLYAIADYAERLIKEEGYEKLTEEDRKILEHAKEATVEDTEKSADKHYDGFQYFAARTVNIHDIFPNYHSSKVIALIDPDDGAYLTSNNDGKELIIALDSVDDRSTDEISVVSAKWLENLLKDRTEEDDELDYDEEPVEVEEEYEDEISDNNTEEKSTDNSDVIVEAVTETISINDIGEINNHQTGVFPPNVSVNGVSVTEDVEV